MAPNWVEELHFPHLHHIPVTIDHISSILPSSPIPSASATTTTLYLSNLDDIVGARVFTPTVYFYPSKNTSSANMKKPCTSLKDALARVLVPYYPFSGRLRETKNGKLEVFFGPKQGALLVEAHSNLALADLGDVTAPNPAWKSLIYSLSNEEQYKVVDMPLVIAQVTQFSCGGFSLGLRICHCVCDGLGAMQFVKAWAATAKTGSLVLNPEPCWDREIFRPRNPPRIEFPHTEYRSVYDGSTLTKSLWEIKPAQKCYRLNRDFLSHLKSLANSTGNMNFTTFDAMAAHVWRSFVKALDIRPLDYELRLTFSVNVRPKLNKPSLKEGFYGNALSIACATCSVSGLTGGSLAEIARTVHEARIGVSEEYLRSTIDYIEINRPERLEFGGKLSITQWTRFGIYESADFGWGRPIYAGPIDLTPTPQVCVFLPEAAEGGIDSNRGMLLCICLPESASATFAQLLSLTG
ncbi:hypothetical protein M9H77_01850 [Catharanthus roseus]|uniref:Uncharacterized protein n=1 Tax=Catharanthus roseus TaxID=4058 RepID=A0ACC0C780_CATRO|nr:hypothetical protein M9H77_01850 [Catharanthus roseus]